MVNLTPNVILLLVTIVVVVVLIILMVGIAVVLETQKKIIKRLKAWKRKNYLCLRKETEFAEFVEYIINKKLNDENEKTFWFNLFIILKQYLINLDIDLVDIIFLS